MLIERVEEEIDLLKRHIDILKIAKEKGPIGMGKISELTGIPKHKIRYSLRILEKEDLIKPTNEGAVAKNVEKFWENFSDKVKFEIEKMKEMDNTLDSF
ncbi:hypothetical protein C9439_05690 [archaeon SCG-AAA382B04]|nr:hypothetical protein C9439_05690 [archaeon SCG-AAA382B04]